MLWKELHIEGGMKMNWVGILVLCALVLLTLGTGLFVLGEHIWTQMIQTGNRRLPLSESMNIWFRLAGTSVACLTILSVAVRASTSISQERERDTFDALIATPLSSEAILGAKLIGSLTSLRLGAIWMGLMLVLALFTGGVHWCAVPIVLTAWLIYSAFFAMVGTWYSMVAKSSMRATVYTVLTTLGLGAGHWLITGLCCVPIYSLMRMHNHQDSFPEYLMKFQAGMTPPFVISWCSYSWENLGEPNWHRQSEFPELLVFCIHGLVLWGIACVILWYAILVPKFRQISRREELMYE